jgi:hypothetical protein
VPQPSHFARSPSASTPAVHQSRELVRPVTTGARPAARVAGVQPVRVGHQPGRIDAELATAAAGPRRRAAPYRPSRTVPGRGPGGGGARTARVGRRRHRVGLGAALREGEVQVNGAPHGDAVQGELEHAELVFHSFVTGAVQFAASAAENVPGSVDPVLRRPSARAAGPRPRARLRCPRTAGRDGPPRRPARLRAFRGGRGVLGRSFGKTRRCHSPEGTTSTWIRRASGNPAAAVPRSPVIGLLISVIQQSGRSPEWRTP